MKRARPNDLGLCLEKFFREYLPALRGMSLHTIRSYRDALVLFLRFMSNDSSRRLEDLGLETFTAEHVTRFLTFLEIERHNGIATRNARLAALHTFARFLASESPEHLAELQRVLGLPFKRGGRNAPIEYLESVEVETLLRQIDRSTETGRRDYALFALMLNTGARVQEVLDLKLSDVRTEPSYQVRLHGKGGKVRLCPIWASTAATLRALAQTTLTDAASDGLLFANRRGGKLTRFGVRYLLNKYISAATTTAGTLQEKRIHPHSLRHTTAICLLKAGVDFATISQWLGHATPNTTMKYARADLDLKRQALTQVFPETLAPTAVGGAKVGVDVVEWLKRL
ncbi:tyrosine-type recombinase/integrase [Burkholderia ubonensis]|uniref:tyrosine-type recombinase/integrase n=1 Tax=Burkholderia ubonensis TaxID=101571 RepID=UPI0007591D40|nr:tyrosine-type recombinase/integrase [Burkholderia ubonensis]KVZ50912.1 integrase [Burkholderia ubonensis]